MHPPDATGPAYVRSRPGSGVFCRGATKRQSGAKNDIRCDWHFRLRAAPLDSLLRRGIGLLNQQLHNYQQLRPDSLKDARRHMGDMRPEKSRWAKRISGCAITMPAGRQSLLSINSVSYFTQETAFFSYGSISPLKVMVHERQCRS